MGEQQTIGQNSGNQNRLFYSFNLDDHVPADHLLRRVSIQFFDLADLRTYLARFISTLADRRSIRNLMIRIGDPVGYCFWDSLGAATLRRGAP